MKSTQVFLAAISVLCLGSSIAQAQTTSYPLSGKYIVKSEAECPNFWGTSLIPNYTLDVQSTGQDVTLLASPPAGMWGGFIPVKPLLVGTRDLELLPNEPGQIKGEYTNGDATYTFYQSKMKIVGRNLVVPNPTDLQEAFRIEQTPDGVQTYEYGTLGCKFYRISN